MNEDPVVTVIIPVYNAGVYLRPAVESILAQTFQDIEIIIIDDGSTDDCMDSITDLSHPRLRTFKQPNVGKATVLNRAIAMARGEYYAVQDADDFSYPTRIEMLVECMRAHLGVAGVFSGYDLLLNDRHVAPRMPDKDEEACHRDIDAFRMPSHDPTPMYRLSMVREIEYAPDLPIVEGFDYILRVGERFPLRVVSDCLYSYRIHNHSITRKSPDDNSRLVRIALRRACDRRGISFHQVFGDDTPDNSNRRIRNRDRDNNLVAHFIESVSDLKARSSPLAALAVGLRCALLHPLDPDYYKALAWAMLPTALVRIIRGRRQAVRFRLMHEGYVVQARRASGTLRVLYSFPQRLGTPGIGATAWHQVASLAERGVSVTVFCGSCERPLPSDIAVRETLRCGAFRLPYRLMGTARTMVLHDLIVASALNRIRDNIDVVHCWPSGSLKTLQMAGDLGVATVLERPSAHTAYVFDKTVEACKELGITLRRSHYAAYDSKRLAREDREFKIADRLLCPSEFTAQTFIDRGYSPAQIARHRYGCDLSRFTTPDDTIDKKHNGTLSMVYVGAGYPLKGLHIGLRAWRRSGAANSGRFLICGEIEPPYRRAMSDLIDHPSVFEMGFVSDIEVIMRDCDILILPSLAEGSALVTYEARACGCVLLVSDASGAPCRHMYDGMVHPAGDVAALAHHIHTVNSDRELLNTLRLTSLRGVWQLSWDSASECLETIYNEVALARTKLVPSMASERRRLIEE